MPRTVFALTAAALLAAPAFAGDLASSVTSADLPEKKRTTLELYLTPEDAAAALAADPSIVFIDVRDPVEVMFVGHADPADAIVPLRTLTHGFDPEKGAYKMAPNPDFIDQVAAVMEREGKGTDDPVFVTCQSGGRTAQAANALAKAGYSNVWALFEGIEGDLDTETGRRDVNGWKNADLPWSYKITAQQAWQPAE